jgi:hypothetical protein
MTLEEWAGRVDAFLAQTVPAIEPHVEGPAIYEMLRERGIPRITPEDPAWRRNGRWASARVAEDDASLRVAFVPRDPVDTRYPDEERSHEKMYVRSDAGAREAALDITRFLREG